MRGGSLQLGPGVVVTGMHRSGTAMLAKLLVHLGAHPGDPASVVPERIAVPQLVAMNDQILDQLDGSWCVPPRDLRPLTSTRFDSVRQAYADALRLLFAQRPWIWQDPRLSLLWPMLDPVFAVPPVRLALVRPPWEVAADHHAEDVFPLDHGVALWDQYTTGAAAPGAGPVIPVLHDDLQFRTRDLATRLVGALGEYGVVLDSRALGGIPAALAAGGPTPPPAWVDDDVRQRWTDVLAWADTGGRLPKSTIDPGALVAARSAIRRWHIPASGADVRLALDSAATGVLDDAGDFDDLVAAADAGTPAMHIRVRGTILHELGEFASLDPVRSVGAALLAGDHDPRHDALRVRLVEAAATFGPTGALDQPTLDRPVWASGLIAESAAVMATPRPAPLTLAPQWWDDPSAPQFAPERARMTFGFEAFRHRDVAVGSGAAVEAAVVGGSFADLLAVLDDRPAVLVGAPHYAGLPSRWRTPGLTFVECHPLTFSQRRREVETRIELLLSTLFDGAPPIVLLAVEPLALLLADVVARARPDATVIDLGSVPDIWFEPWRNSHAWFDPDSVDGEALRLS